MTKTLKVIDPFFVMDLGDTFELVDNGMYTSEHNEEFYKMGGKSEEINSVYNSNFSISPEYAQELIKQGYLEEVPEKKMQESTPFVNVFDEITGLIDKYNTELAGIKNDNETPELMKYEKKTVLANLVKVLEHLKGLKK